MRGGGIPVPIPNTTVKPFAADGTMLETVWKSRRLPELFLMIMAYKRPRTDRARPGADADIWKLNGNEAKRDAERTDCRVPGAVRERRSRGAARIIIKNVLYTLLQKQ